MSMTDISKEPYEVLEYVPHIEYPVQFWKGKKEDVWVLIDSGNKINVITLAYAAKLSLKICSTNVGA